MQHYCCRMDYDKGTYTYLEEIPSFEDIDGSY